MLLIALVIRTLKLMSRQDHKGYRVITKHGSLSSENRIVLETAWT